MDPTILMGLVPEIAKFLVEKKVNKTEDQIVVLLALQLQQTKSLAQKIDELLRNDAQLAETLRAVREGTRLIEGKVDILLSRSDDGG